MKNDKIKKTKPLKKGAVYLNYGMTLADVLTQLAEAGVTDFSKVRYDFESVSGGCTCNSDDYCYCDYETTYKDIRFNWEI